MAFLSGIHFLTGWHCKFRPNTEGVNNTMSYNYISDGPHNCILGGGNEGTVRVFEQDFALEDDIGSHACSLEARTCV
jgi:hypothetical protein